MKNTVIYYVTAFSPFIALIYGSNAINGNLFILLLFAYLLVYRPVLDRLRLMNKGVLTREKAMRFYFPGLSYYYFKELYLP